MKKYRVEFWYNTDLRWFEEIDTNDEVSAFVLARSKSRDLVDWSNNSNRFYIVIRLAE
jgi:hypothetical protein